MDIDEGIAPPTSRRRLLSLVSECQCSPTRGDDAEPQAGWAQGQRPRDEGNEDDDGHGRQRPLPYAVGRKRGTRQQPTPERSSHHPPKGLDQHRQRRSVRGITGQRQDHPRAAAMVSWLSQTCLQHSPGRVAPDALDRELEAFPTYPEDPCCGTRKQGEQKARRSSLREWRAS